MSSESFKHVGEKKQKQSVQMNVDILNTGDNTEYAFRKAYLDANPDPPKHEPQHRLSRSERTRRALGALLPRHN